MAQLTANSDYIETQILSLSPYDASSNPTGVKDGDLYFSTDTRRLFLGLVSSSGVLSWRSLDSSSTQSSTGSSAMLSSGPMMWLDAQSEFSNDGVALGGKLKTIKDRSGNDFHYCQNQASKLYTLGSDGGINYWDKGTLSAASIRYRCVSELLNACGLRIGGSLQLSNGACSFMTVFKLKNPFASGTGVDQSGQNLGIHNLPYEECTTHEQKLNCTSTDPSAWSLFPFYGGLGLNQYSSATAAKYGGIFYAYLMSTSSNTMLPRRGIFNGAHSQWNTLFVRSAADGKALEVLLNGRNFLSMSFSMKEGAEKKGKQLEWVTTPPNDDSSLKTDGTTWVEGSSTYLLSENSAGNGPYYRMPYVEPAYEYYPADHKDGNTSDIAVSVAVNGSWSATHSGKRSSGYSPWRMFYNNSIKNFGGNMPLPYHLRANSISLDAANNTFDLNCYDMVKNSEVALWSKRISDSERDAVLQETHAKYMALGNMPALPATMMPGKSNVLSPPFI